MMTTDSMDRVALLARQAPATPKTKASAAAMPIARRRGRRGGMRGGMRGSGNAARDSGGAIAAPDMLITSGAANR
jgi:predicted outer membrane repeat protein